MKPAARTCWCPKNWSVRFFRLSTGLAGEILQKYVNYAGRVAFFGDFSLSQQEALALLTR